MNPEQYLHAVQSAIEKRDKSHTGKFHLCFFDMMFRCVPTKHTNCPHKVFFELTEAQCVKGLKNSQWERLLWDIADFAKADFKFITQVKAEGKS